MTAVSAVICAYGDQPHLRDVVASLRASEQVSVEILVVDNGSPDCADLPEGVVLLQPGRNTGFAGGCNLGARHATGSTLVFVNSDAVVDAHCLALLHEQTAGGDVVGATILVADEPDTVNSWGNPVHVLGFSWAGGYGHPADQAAGGAVASVSGAVFAMRRDTYLHLGGMDDEYFAYGEDVDVSLRAWLSGRHVRVLTGARAWHHYDFSRNPAKMYLLERNRLITVLTTYQARTLVALAPLLLAAEAGLLLRSRAEGWGDQKLAGWRWLASHRRYLRARRNRLQGTRRVPDAHLLTRMTLSLDPPSRFGMSIPARWQAAIDGYWRLIGASLAGVRPGQVEPREHAEAGH
jgi:GT2 family glycosyltransferase